MLEMKQKHYLIPLLKYNSLGPASVYIGPTATSERRKSRGGEESKQGHLKDSRGREATTPQECGCEAEMKT